MPAASMRGGAKILGASTALACVLASGAASASPEDLFGYGARTGAMGATGTAYAGGYEAAWSNPALASTARAPRLTLGWLGATFGLSARGAGLPGDVSTAPAKGTVIGAELPIPFGGLLRDRIGVSLAFYEPTDVVVRGRVLYPEKTQFPMLQERAQSVTIRGAFGVDIGRGLKVGAGFAALAEIEGIVVAATDATGRVGTRVEDQLVATYAPTVGATWDLPLRARETWRVGLTWRGTLDARFAIVVDGTKLSTLNIPLFNISGVAQYDPAQAALELARIDDLTVLAAQVVYKRWSPFSGILEPTVVCSDGGAGACGVVPPTIDWRDTVAVRLGAEQGFRLTRGLVMRARGGAFFETSPLPSELPSGQVFDRAASGVVDVPTRYFDSNRAAVTAGVGVAIDPVQLDLFAQYHVLLPRTIKSVGSDGATLSEGEASGRMTVFGMTAGVRF
jgi:hypothetical protein